MEGEDAGSGFPLGKGSLGGRNIGKEFLAGLEFPELHPWNVQGGVGAAWDSGNDPFPSQTVPCSWMLFQDDDPSPELPFSKDLGFPKFSHQLEQNSGLDGDKVSAVSMEEFQERG